MKQEIIDIFAALGITETAAIPFSPVSGRLLDVRAAARLPERPAGVIMALLPYKLPAYPGLNISKYAAVPDYHEVFGGILSSAAGSLRALYPDEEFEPFCDNSPIPEVYAAALSGLGAVGDHGLLINDKYGSYVFIGEIVTTMALAADPAAPVKLSDTAERSDTAALAVPPLWQHNQCDRLERCNHCGACAAACPAAVIDPDGVKSGDKSGCFSAVTQKKGELSESETAMIQSGGSAWGCDICQNVCPLNSGKAVTEHPQFTGGALCRVTEETPFAGRAWSWRGPEVIRRNLRIISKK